MFARKSRVNPFYLVAALFLALDALAVILTALVYLGVMQSLPGLAWLRVHLLTIGVAVEMIFGTLPGLTAAQFGTRPPSRIWNAALWLLVNAGLVLLVIGMPSGQSQVAALGGVSILAALVLLLILVYRQWQQRVAHASASALFYVAGPLFFVLGILMALSMLLTWPAPGGLSGLLEAHVHANVWGFLALVVAGFLLDYTPRWVAHPLRWPAIVRPTAWFVLLGAFILVAGPWLNILPMTVLGIALYMTGTLLLLANLTGTIAAARGWTPSLAHLSAAYVWMLVPAFVAPIILFTTGKLPSGSVETAAVSGLIAGWVLQVVLGAVPLRLGSNDARREGSWFSVVVLNLGVALLWLAAFWGDFNSAQYVVATGYGLILVGWLPLLFGLVGRLLAAQQTA